MTMSMPGRNKLKERSPPEPQTQPPSEIASSPPWKQAYLLPPGYKFVPSDGDLVLFYLKAYLDGNKSVLLNVPIHRVNIYESNPEQLSVDFKKGNEKQWFFISERNKIGCKEGKKQKRGDNGGYWHATVAAKEINAGEGVVGYKTALAYYTGKQPHGVKTKWLMQEYWFPQSCVSNDKDYALCTIYLSPQALKRKKAKQIKNETKKKKKESVAPTADVKAMEEQQQPCNVEYHKLQQFLQAPMDSYQPQPRRPQPHRPQPRRPQPHDIAYEQQQFWPGMLDPHRPQPHDIAYEQQQLWPGMLDPHRPQPHDIAYQQQPYDIAYEQKLHCPMMRLEEEIGDVTQHQQQQLSLSPPTHGQDSRSEMTGWSTQDDLLLDMYNDDRVFDMDELFDNEEEQGAVTQQQQQQQQQQEQSAPILPPPLQGQDPTSEVLMTNQNWLDDPFNGEYFDIDELLNEIVKKDQDVSLPKNG